MRGGRRVAAALVAALPAVLPAVLVALLVAGCSTDSGTPRSAKHRAGDHRTRAADPVTTPSPSPTDGNGALVPPLPDLSRFPTTTTGPRDGDQRHSHGRLLGADVSWPQCPKGMGIPQKRSEGLPMPSDEAAFVVLGLTNGPSFVANPCLARQVTWVRDRHLLAAAYAVVSYPDDRTLARLGHRGPYDGGTRLGALRNVGYQAALFNVASMRRVGLSSPIVWIDVESVPHFDWSRDPTANGAVVQGAVRGYASAGLRTGFYSTPVLWRGVVGGLRFGSPEWRAAGDTSMAEALRRCATDWSIQGGSAVFDQWVEGVSDRNVTCPGVRLDLSRWFHQF